MTAHYSTIQILAAVLVLVAGATDLHSRRIPNWLNLAGIAAGFAANWSAAGASGLWTSFSGLLLGFGVYFALYALRAMGAGDVKLMAALGAIVGPGDWFKIFLATAIAGGVIAVAMMIWTGRVKETLANTFFIVGELIHLRPPFERGKHLDVKNSNALRMPHGVAIAAGTLACLAFAVI
jgi:prepilin peptidase CpaA